MKCQPVNISISISVFLSGLLVLEPFPATSMDSQSQQSSRTRPATQRALTRFEGILILRFDGNLKGLKCGLSGPVLVWELLLTIPGRAGADRTPEPFWIQNSR